MNARERVNSFVDREWMSDERFDQIIMLLDIVGSHCRIASEGCFLRNQALTGDHLRRARDGLVLAIRTFKDLPTDDPDNQTGEQPLSSPGKHGPPDG